MRKYKNFEISEKFLVKAKQREIKFNAHKRSF